MAINLNGTLIRVTACTVRRQSNSLAYVGWFGEADSCTKEKLFEFDGELDGNVIAQAYEHVKTLPEFAGSVDC